MTRPKVIACINRKGGVGKTTTIANLAIELIELGFTVSIVDADHVEKGTKTWTEDRMGNPKRGLIKDLVTFVYDAKPESLHRAVEAVGHVDYLLMDTPPSLADTAILAATLADLVLIPTFPGEINERPVLATLKWLEENRDILGNPLVGVVAGQVRGNEIVSRNLLEFLESLEVPLLGTIPASTVFPQSQIDGYSLAEFSEYHEARFALTGLSKKVLEVLGHE